MFERFTQKAVNVIHHARQQTRKMKRFSVGSEQLLLGLFLEKSGLASEVLVEFDLTFNMLKQQAEGYGVCDPLVTVKDKLPFTSSVLKILDNSSRISTELGHGYISTEHLFLALLEDQPGRGMQILRTYNVKTMLLRIKINAAIGASDKHAKRMKAMICSFSDTPNLDSYTENLTEMVFDEKLHIIYGRTNEIDVLIRILGRRTKNNPLLLGESGVGKTAVVEGLALQCATLHVPEFLKAAILMRIDMKQVLMGSGVKTEFDDRITAVLNEIIGLVGYSIPYSTPIYPILVLDDMHTIVGSNAAESGFDASTIIKFALQTGKFSCIGITTNEDYKTHIEPDVRLSCYFQVVKINEPSVEMTALILRILRGSFELFHEVMISEDALEAAAMMSHNFIQDRYLPVKAIDLLDETTSAVKQRSIRAVPDKFISVQEKVRVAILEKKSAIKIEDYSAAAEAFNKEMDAMAELSALTQAFLEAPTLSYIPTDKVVLDTDIAELTELWSGVPVQVTQSQSEDISKMAIDLRSRIIGQKQAVNSVIEAVKRARVGIKNPNRPIATFLFSGPTGVGKTELVKALAICFYHSKSAMVRLDMSEYMERHSVSKLIGSPPGYVGYGEGGQLTEAVRKKPYSIILFDEVEKAHPSVFNLLLQVLEDGRLTDSKGRTINFKNTIVILTSNIGANLLNQEPKEKDDELKEKEKMEPASEVEDHIGYTFWPATEPILPPLLPPLEGVPVDPPISEPNIESNTENDSINLPQPRITKASEEKDENERLTKYNAMKSVVTGALVGFFRPEFLNRLDEIIVFDHLSKEDLKQIAKLLLKELSSRLTGKYELVVDDEARDFLINSEYNRLYGARPLRRAFMNLLESLIAQAILDEKVVEGDKITFIVDKTTNTIDYFTVKSDKLKDKIDGERDGNGETKLKLGEYSYLTLRSDAVNNRISALVRKNRATIDK